MIRRSGGVGEARPSKAADNLPGWVVITQLSLLSENSSTCTFQYYILPQYVFKMPLYQAMLPASQEEQSHPLRVPVTN